MARDSSFSVAWLGAFAGPVALVIAGVYLLAIRSSDSPGWLFPVAWVYIGLGLAGVVSVAALWWLKRSDSAGEGRPEPTRTFHKTQVDEMNADVDSTAERLADKSRFGKWLGKIRHHPKRNIE